ncbi:MAG: hypothetical protein K0U29_05495 [Gammaproteobacteria bacterium]|nr:hypothetical protein [Gammaproteobacteria bacterium]
MTDDIDNNDDDKLDIEQSLESLSEKYGIKVDHLREMSEEDIYYLIYHCPFLQIVNTQARFEGLNPEVAMVQSDSGWTILDYGDAMSSSIGKFLFSSGDSGLLYAKDDDGDGGDSGIGGNGTFINQAFITATQMVEMAQQQGWAGIKFVDGHTVMARAAWIKAQSLGLPFEGFSPTEKDIQVAERIQMSSGEMEVLRSQVTRSLTN